MTDSLVLTQEKLPGIAMITLNRPKKCNALNVSLLENLCSAIKYCHQKTGIRVLILNGNGPVFCSGMDLHEASNHDIAHTSSKMLAKTLKMIYFSPLITIAATHGAAIAEGAGIMSACDFTIASEDLRIAFPETSLGLVAGLVITLLHRKLQESYIRELVLLGGNIQVERAHTMGLVTRIVPSANVIDEALNIASQILQNAPGATATSKRLIEEFSTSSLENEIDKALDYHMQIRHSREAREGIHTFLEKRQPSWNKQS